ncbi:DUF2460 domain-containing protein [Methylibium sp.]|uniref:DUF2460 domain-containing protein n=1 Tax=Methylibium sp. TaxID=2067992 RepID=UPI003D0D7CF0
MSQAVFPTFIGLKWGGVRAPLWRTTLRSTPSGREFSTRNMVTPRYLYKLSYEVLREKDGFNELLSLESFFNLRNGAFDSFLYPDPDDNAVTAHSFGTGTGSATAFQLVRSRGGFVQPVYDLVAAPQIYVNGTLQVSGYTVSASGLVTFSSAPANGAALTWTGSYYWRVRFKQDSTEFSQFLFNLWEAKTVELITRKP